MLAGKFLAKAISICQIRQYFPLYYNTVLYQKKTWLILARSSAVRDYLAWNTAQRKNSKKSKEGFIVASEHQTIPSSTMNFTCTVVSEIFAGWKFSLYSRLERNREN